MERTITIIILLSVIWLFATYNPNTLTAEIQHTDIIKYYQLYDKINALEANIDTLNSKCLCLENKIAALEKAVEREVFDDNELHRYDQNYSHPFIQHIDPIKEEYWEWQKKKWENMPQMPDLEYQEFLREREKKAKADTTTYKISVVSTYDDIEIDSLECNPIYIVDSDNDKIIKQLTKEVHDNYDETMEEIIMLWEAIYKLQDEK